MKRLGTIWILLSMASVVIGGTAAPHDAWAKVDGVQIRASFAGTACCLGRGDPCGRAVRAEPIDWIGSGCVAVCERPSQSEHTSPRLVAPHPPQAFGWRSDALSHATATGCSPMAARDAPPLSLPILLCRLLN